MDPLTAVSLAIVLIRGGIQIYQALHDHSSATPSTKAMLKPLIEAAQSHVAALEVVRDTLDLSREVQSP